MREGGWWHIWMHSEPGWWQLFPHPSRSGSGINFQEVFPPKLEPKVCLAPSFPVFQLAFYSLDSGASKIEVLEKEDALLFPRPGRRERRELRAPWSREGEKSQREITRSCGIPKGIENLHLPFPALAGSHLN